MMGQPGTGLFGRLNSLSSYLRINRQRLANAPTTERERTILRGKIDATKGELKVVRAQIKEEKEKREQKKQK